MTQTYQRKHLSGILNSQNNLWKSIKMSNPRLEIQPPGLNQTVQGKRVNILRTSAQLSFPPIPDMDIVRLFLKVQSNGCKAT